MPRLLLSVLLLSPIAALAAEPVAVAPPVFDAQGRTVGKPLAERVVDYEIDARLDPAQNTLTGQESITWRNRSAEPQATLWFHLYWNAFKNDRSTFYRDSRDSGGFRDEQVRNPAEYPVRKKDEWGYSDVKAISVRGSGEDLLPTLKFQHPDDDNADDQTVFTVTLPKPVPAGGSVTLDVRWEARVPRLVARAGHSKTNDFFLIGQWFPKLGVLEIPPERGITAPRWNCHQYHALSEFFADFATFDVRVTTPKALTIGAAGVLVESKDNPDGTTTRHYHQDDVVDFVWTAWKKVEVIEDVFRAPGLPEVALTVMLDPRHHRSGPQMVAAAKATLEHYGRWWYPYPYPHLTIVSPPTNSPAAGGMEYPTFITTVGREEPAEPKDYLVWQVLAHELGHNYWMGIMASNEFEESWLDEGINSYGTYKLTTAENIPLRSGGQFPSPLKQLLGGIFELGWTEPELIRGFTSARNSSPIVRESWKFRNRGDYSRNSYTRPQLTLIALERLVGEETMARIMRTYVDRFKFRHPSSEDFFKIANEVTGQDLGWFWDEFFRGTGSLDYGVSQLSCAEVDPAVKWGVYEDGKGGHSVLERPKAMPGKKDDDKAVNRCELEVERIGEIHLPVEVKVTFEDGKEQLERWDGKDRWHRWTYERPGKNGRIKQAEVGPAGLAALDANQANNTRARSFSGHVPMALFGWTTYLGQFLSTLASFFA